MAQLMACATGNWGTAATWALVDATTFLNAESNNTALSTTEASNRAAAGTTPGAITIDGFALKIASRAASPTGTMTVRLWNLTAAAAVTGTTVTVNISDLPLCTTTDVAGGWVFFKFAAPVTLLAANSYIASPVTSNASQVNLYRNATGSNWSKMLRTTTTQAPAAGDDMAIVGEKTGQATSNSLTVTMNETANTDYGTNTTTEVTPAVAVGNGGTLTYNNASAANPYLRLSGSLVIYNGGTFNMGTHAAPIPRDSIAVLEFDCAADGNMGLTCRSLGTLNIAGLSRTSGKDVSWCLLNTDEAVNSTSLGVDRDTGWLDNDVIGIASTTTTAAQCETGALNGNAGASSLTVDGFGGAGGGLAFAHGGTAPVQAEVVMLTRNVIVRPVTSTAGDYVRVMDTATVVVEWAAFPNIWGLTASARGFEIQTTTGSCTVSYCSFYDTERDPMTLVATNLDNVLIDNCVFYNICTANTGSGVLVGLSVAATNVEFNACVVIKSTQGAFLFQCTPFSFIDCRMAGSVGNGFGVSQSGGGQLGTWRGIVSHSNTASGGVIGALVYGTIEDLTCYRNGSFGLDGRGGGFQTIAPLVLDNYVAFGCLRGILLGTGSPNYYHFIGGSMSGDTTTGMTSGIGWTQSIQNGANFVTCENVQFSPTSGIFIPVTTGDLDMSTGGGVGSMQVYLNNCLMGATNEIGAGNNLNSQGYIHSTNHDQVAGAQKSWYIGGNVLRDTTIFNSTPASIRLTPRSATIKLVTALYGDGFTVPVTNGVAITLSAQVRKSEVADGAAYNGNQPRLIVRANPSIGISSDTVVATYASGTGSWNLLSGASPTPTADGYMEVFFDCDGTAGWVNVDDVTLDTIEWDDTWFNAVPFMPVGNGSGGGEHFHAAIGL